MIYAVVHGKTTTYIQAKSHRARYVAQRIAGWRTETSESGDSVRVPNDFKLEVVGRIKTIRAHARTQRRLAALRKRLGGEVSNEPTS